MRLASFVGLRCMWLRVVGLSQVSLDIVGFVYDGLRFQGSVGWIWSLLDLIAFLWFAVGVGCLG